VIKNEVIKELLALLAQATKNLKSKQKVSLEEYLEPKNWELRDVVEREMERAIQSCIDMGTRLISQEGFPKAEDYHHIFNILFQEKVISANLAKKMKEMVGFRNLLIHEYRRIKHEEVYRHLQKDIPIFREFSHTIIKYLEE
jgi:uncharacterized protein YutE (UPF0331/DUF86 family)